MEKKGKSIKEKFKIILGDRIFVFLVLGGLFLNIVNFVIIKIFINFDQAVLILHYNVFFGIDKVGLNVRDNVIQLFFVPMGSCAIWFINLFLGIFLYLTSLGEELQFTETFESGDKSFKNGKNDEIISFRSKVFGAYLFLGASLAVSTTIGIYVLSIILVNN